MRLVLPRKPDPSVKLDCLRSTLVECIATARFRDSCRFGKLSIELIRNARCIPQSRFRRFETHLHVRKLMLHGLKAGDRPTELNALPGIRASRVKCPLRTANSLRCNSYTGALERPLEPVPRGLELSEDRIRWNLHRIECYLSHPPREIQHDRLINGYSRRTCIETDDADSLVTRRAGC